MITESDIVSLCQQCPIPNHSFDIRNDIQHLRSFGKSRVEIISIMEKVITLGSSIGKYVSVLSIMQVLNTKDVT